ncbi:hypothetical protein ACFSBX_17200 [Halobellus rarus]|uniref:DNA recombination and repair protein Rad51-like C-terminal domain-containing protein n=1 Tax=Halobellus rarus TaxID=1126237 RepID=A0ABD6CR70_9EURY
MPKRSTSISNQLAVDQPTRDADRNRTLTEQADPTTEKMLLPSLEDGITLLDIEGGRGVPILQSLALDHLLLHDGPAFWVDANGHATTTTLAQIAPSQRLLDRIHVARGFTAYQHYGTVCDLPTAVNQSIRRSTANTGTSSRQSTARNEDASSHTPSLIVAPAVDAQYRTDDTLGDAHAETLQARTLARLATYADGYDVPVLVTRSKADEFSAPIATAADRHLECEQTRMGPRFVGDEFETLVYPVDDGAYYQTTFAYWRQLLGARAEQVGLEPASPSTPTTTSDGVGTGMTANGTTASLTANPLLDAWTSAGGR